MNREFDNGFDEEEERLRGRGERDLGAGAGADSDTMLGGARKQQAGDKWSRPGGTRRFRRRTGPRTPALC
ncbi:MAG: hypothetical protein ACLR0U_27235 [Enterocloster clostridioformis]